MNLIVYYDFLKIAVLPPKIIFSIWENINYFLYYDFYKLSFLRPKIIYLIREHIRYLPNEQALEKIPF